MPLVHRLSPFLRVLHYLLSLLLQEPFFLCFRLDCNAMRFGMVVFVQVGEGGKAVGGDFLGFAAAVHFCIHSQGAATYGDDLALESDDVTSENRELEVDAMEHQQDGILCVNILRHSEIRTL